jgi:hypothetical protein
MAVWTEERRKRQAEAIKRHKPWLKSTGPKTRKGKNRSRYNALKHGRRANRAPEINALLKLNAQFVSLSKMMLADTSKIWQTDELIENRLKSKLKIKNPSLPRPN